MQTGDECELKYRLPSGEPLRKLRSRLPSGAFPVRQTNDYFDAADLRLCRAGVMLRVRRESPLARSGEARILLTFKEGGRVGEGLFRAREHTRPLTFAQWRALRRDPDRIWALGDAPVAAMAERFGRPPLEGVGTLATERYAFRMDGGLLVELDRVIYPDGHEEFEIEVETDAPERVGPRVVAFLKDLGIEAVPASRTKLERLLERLRGPGALGVPEGEGGR